MLLKEGTLLIASVITLLMSLTSPDFAQSAANAARALALEELLDSIEGVGEEPPRVFTTKDGYLRFVMAPPSNHFAVTAAARGTPP